jgi:hypothetical protein
LRNTYQHQLWYQAPTRDLYLDTGEFESISISTFGDFQASPRSSPRGSADNVFEPIKGTTPPPSQKATNDLMSLNDLFGGEMSGNSNGSITHPILNSNSNPTISAIKKVVPAFTADFSKFKSKPASIPNPAPSASSTNQDSSSSKSIASPSKSPTKSISSTTPQSFTTDFKSLSLAGVFLSSDGVASEPSGMSDVDLKSDAKPVVDVVSATKSVAEVDIFADFKGVSVPVSNTSNDLNDLFSADFIPPTSSNPVVKPVKSGGGMDIFASFPAPKPKKVSGGGKATGVNDLLSLDFGNPVDVKIPAIVLKTLTRADAPASHSWGDEKTVSVSSTSWGDDTPKPKMTWSDDVKGPRMPSASWGDEPVAVKSVASWEEAPRPDLSMPSPGGWGDDVVVHEEMKSPAGWEAPPDRRQRTPSPVGWGDDTHIEPVRKTSPVLDVRATSPAGWGDDTHVNSEDVKEIGMSSPGGWGVEVTQGSMPSPGGWGDSSDVDVRIEAIERKEEVIIQVVDLGTADAGGYSGSDNPWA